jgi:hypothetical protein
MMGERKMVLLIDVRAMSMRGMDAERKRSSSVTGPWVVVRRDGQRSKGMGQETDDDDVTPGCPFGMELVEGGEVEPLLPAGVDDEVAEEGPEEEKRGEGEGAESVEERRRPDSGEVEDFGRRCAGGVGEDDSG